MEIYMQSDMVGEAGAHGPEKGEEAPRFCFIDQFSACGLFDNV
jgi:hypothetical protein